MKEIIKKINNFDIGKNSFFITYIIISIISLLYATKTLIVFSQKKLIISLILLVFIEIFIYLFLRKKIKNNIEIHKLYLVIIIILGTFYIFGFPPSQIPDDRSDYLRSLEVSEFHVTSIKRRTKVGRSYPKNILKVYESNNYKDYLDNSKLKLEGEKKFIAFANKSLYSFVCYIPQAIGVGIGRILSLPIVFQSILGKIFNFSLFVILSYLSIKYIPIKKELVFFICLLPMTIQEATSLSADCMTIASAIALESFIIWARYTKKRFNNKHYISLALLSICLSLSKIVYLPLCFLILLIPNECFNNKNKKIKYCSVVLLISIILNLIWLKISSPYLEAFMSYRGSDSTAQLKYILTNPLRYIVILFETIDNSIYSYLDQMVGHSLGTFSVNTSYVFVILSLSILFYLIFKKESKEIILNNVEKIFSILLSVATIVLIFTSLYLQWTPLKETTIDGIQGRYFIPILLLITMPIMSKEVKKDRLNALTLIVSIFFNIISIISIYIEFL